MPPMSGEPRGIIGKNIAELMKSGRRREQAAAIVSSKTSKAKPRYK